MFDRDFRGGAFAFAARPQFILDPLAFMRATALTVALVLLILTALLISPAHAWAATADAPLGIVVGPTLTVIAQVVAAVLMAMAPWLVKRVLDLLHVQVTAKANALILSAVDNAITYATNVGATKVANLQIKVADPKIATAANYVIDKMPGTLRKLGVDVTTAAGQQHVADLVVSRLPAAAPSPAAS